MELLSEFLENSSIHGLNHIVTSKSPTAKIIWAAIVIASFSTAGLLIRNSYRDWASSPISTSISTHPISSLPFPQVTVCPPKGSNTALNYDLVRLNNTLTEDTKDTLKRAVDQIFIKNDHNKYAVKMKVLTNDHNIRKIYEGFQAVPKHVGNIGHEVRFSSSAGEITTPHFGKDFDGEHYSEDHNYHYILEFPANTGELLGPTGSLVVKLDVDTREEEDWSESVKYRVGPKYKYYDVPMAWEDAEAHCVELGGHLASVTSKKTTMKCFLCKEQMTVQSG